MKKRLLALFLAAVLVSLAACAQNNMEEAQNPEQTTEETPSESVPPTDTQSSEQTAPWAQWEPAIPTDMELCSATSGYAMAETETGYYLCMGETLYYADKSDLTNWVVACNMPDCSHRGPRCPARVGFEFYLEDGRIWSVREPQVMGGNDQLDPNAKSRVGVYSTAMDGTDLRCEYIMEGTMGAGAWSSLLTPGKVYGTFSLMQTDGNYHNSIMVADSTGTTVLKESTTQDRKPAEMTDGAAFSLILGDPILCSSIWDDIEMPYLRDTGNGLEEVPGMLDFDAHELYGSCLRGDTLLHFVPNDGYYRTNLADGTSEKGMNPQLTGSRACWFPGGYVVEGNVFAREPFETPEIRIYNGAEWKPVTLPEGIQLTPEESIGPCAISTEAIFFRGYRKTGTGDSRSMTAELYMVPLNSDSYTMTFCGSFPVY